VTTNLPPITVTCRNDHSFTTKAAGSTSVSCPVCRKTGERIAVWVPANRPKTARESAARRPEATPADDATQDAARTAAARWDAEKPWSGKLTVLSGRENDTCPQCSEPLSWEPGRTLTYCPECKSLDLPPAIISRYESQQDGQPSGVVAIRADPTAERAARARIRAVREMSAEWLKGWIETVADEEYYDRSQWQQQARQLAALLRGFIPEIQSAQSEEELGEIKSYIVSEILTSEMGEALTAEYHQSIARTEKAAADRERFKDQRLQQLEWQAQNQIDQARAAQLESARARQIEAERHQIEAAPRQIVRITPKPVSADTGLISIAIMMQQRAKAIEQKIAERGQCAFDHRMGPFPADRIYGIPDYDYNGKETGYTRPETPRVLACYKHFKAADDELKRQGHTDLRWWTTNDS
jgi:hypothetical protein